MCCVPAEVTANYSVIILPIDVYSHVHKCSLVSIGNDRLQNFFGLREILTHVMNVAHVGNG